MHVHWLTYLNYWSSAAVAHSLQGLTCVVCSEILFGIPLFVTCAIIWVTVTFLSAWNSLGILLGPLPLARRFCAQNSCSLDSMYLFSSHHLAVNSSDLCLKIPRDQHFLRYSNHPNSDILSEKLLTSWPHLHWFKPLFVGTWFAG